MATKKTKEEEVKKISVSLNLKTISIPIEGVSPLIMSRFDEKSKQQIEEIGKAEKGAIPAEIQALLEARAAARAAKNWAESDRLRGEIAARGWAVKDAKDGQTCTKA